MLALHNLIGNKVSNSEAERKDSGGGDKKASGDKKETGEGKKEGEKQTEDKSKAGDSTTGKKDKPKK